MFNSNEVEIKPLEAASLFYALNTLVYFVSNNFIKLRYNYISLHKIII